MKNTRALIMMLFSLFLGLVAVVVAGKWISDQTRVDASTVLVAARDIDVGTRLSGDMLSKADWPSASRPDGAFQEVELLEGRVLKSHLVRGEAVLESKLAPVGTSGGLSGVISEGKRAITARQCCDRRCGLCAAREPSRYFGQRTGRKSQAFFQDCVGTNTGIGCCARRWP